MNRREFLWTMASLPLLSSCQPNVGHHAFSGQLLGPNFDAGHRLRNHDLPAFTDTKRTQVAIIGGGISGLSAGWHLQQQGIHDYRIFELEEVTSGNARGGRNTVSAYPWGAHYLPIPNANDHALKSFLAQVGVITAGAESAKPTYEERFLCFEPQERLYIHGQWQDGLLPKIGNSSQDHAQFQRFDQLINAYSHAQGRDGRDAFAIPIEESSEDHDFLALDAMSMQTWLHQQQLDSQPLHWYINYACRDDYGTHYSQISAWAGIHYFASRHGQAANADINQVLTWPEGNAWLAHALANPQSAQIQTSAMASQISIETHQAVVDVYALNAKSTTRWLADEVIFASPFHLLPHLLKTGNSDLLAAASEIPHAPWLVANLTLNSPPQQASAGVGLAWDNVIYDSENLGYVVANHQSLQREINASVITYYQPFAQMSPQAARQQLLSKPWQYWADGIVNDLQKPHPDIRQQIESMDIFRWGHAMTYPCVGFLTSAQRKLLNTAHERLQLAHTDSAGISIFEEAFAQGRRAAERIAKKRKT